jgi:hypothetical protein
MIKQIGSQAREPLADTDYKFVSFVPDMPATALLEDKETGKRELWVENDHFAGYTIEIDGKGYEFVRSVVRGEDWFAGTH